MKKNIFYLLSAFMSTFASAQHCSKSNFESAFAAVNSHELNDHIGNLDVKITLTGKDSAFLIGWSFNDSFFTASLLNGFTKNFISIIGWCPHQPKTEWHKRLLMNPK